MEQITGMGEKISLIHFIYMSNPQGGLGEGWRIACMPNMREFHATAYHTHYERTDETRAVTCPGCKNTEIFKTKKQALENLLRKHLGG